MKPQYVREFETGELGNFENLKVVEDPTHTLTTPISPASRCAHTSICREERDEKIQIFNK